MSSAERSKAVVLLLLIDLFIVLPLFCGGYVWYLFCSALLSVVSSFVTISLGKRELVALLLLPFKVI